MRRPQGSAQVGCRRSPRLAAKGAPGTGENPTKTTIQSVVGTVVAPLKNANCGRLTTDGSCRVGSDRRRSDRSWAACYPLCKRRGCVVLTPQRPPRCRRSAFKERPWPCVLPYLPSRRRSRAAAVRHECGEPIAPCSPPLCLLPWRRRSLRAAGMLGAAPGLRHSVEDSAYL